MRKITVPEEGIETLFGVVRREPQAPRIAFDVRIRTQGHELLVEGDPADEARVERTRRASWPR